MSGYERLASLDASFLHLERLEYPMHVGAVSIFEGTPFFDADGCFRLAAVRDLVESRLPLIPRYRKRLMLVPFDQGRPIWIDDDHFDIAYHVRLTALPKPGSWEQLVALTQRVEEQLLDRERPLWELWFVEGLEGGKVALIQKTHHALVDGVSGVDVATILFDMSPEHQPAEPPEWVPESPPTASELLVETLRERITEPAEMMRTVRRALRGPRVAMDRVAQLARSLAGDIRGARRRGAAHIAQHVTHRTPPTPGDGPRLARRREAHPPRLRRHRQRRRALGSFRGSRSPVEITR